MKTFEKQCPYPPCSKVFHTANRYQKHCSQTCARRAKTVSTKEAMKAYLLRNVHVPDHPDACWEWQGYISKGNGYGRACVRRQQIDAHRLAYEIFVGPIPEGMYVLHARHCLYRHCINPRHLYCGTAQQNAHDAIAVGHMPQGSGHYKARLTEAKVLNILKRYHDNGVSLKTLAREEHMSYSAIQLIILRINWKHVAPGLYPYVPARPHRILTENDIPRIRQLAADGIPKMSIAKQFAVSPRQIRNIIERKSWKHVD